MATTKSVAPVTTSAVDAGKGFVYDNVTDQMLLVPLVKAGDQVINVKDAAYGAKGDDSTNDNTAIQNAVNALPATGGNLFFPPGVYRVNTAALTGLPSGSRVSGAGRGATILKSTSGTHDLWSLPAGATRLLFDSLTMQTHSGGGHIFAPAGQVTFVNLHNLSLQQLNPAKSIWKQGNFGYYFNLWLDVYLYHDGATSVPAVDFTSATTGIHNANTWQQCTIENAAAANFWFFDFATSSTGDYLYDNIFRDLTCEVSNGGIARLRTCNGFVFDNVDIYDQTTTTKDLFWVGSGGGAISSRQTLFRHVVRRGGALGGGLTDIFLESNKAADTQFEYCNTATGSGFVVNLNGNPGAFGVGCNGVTFQNKPATFFNFGSDFLKGSAVWDPASLTNGTSASTTVTVTGAAAGDMVTGIGHTAVTAAGWTWRARVSSANTVSVELVNNTGGTVDLASGTLTVMVTKQ